jgi:hypothetical protein
MRALTARAFIAVAVLLAGASCDRDPAPEPEPEPVRVSIGAHDVAFRVPEGWLHLDHGLEHRFQREIAQISLADYGPVTAEGYVREIERARELFRRNQVLDARAHLDRLHLRPAFDDAGDWKDFTRWWRVVRDGGLGRNVEGADVEGAYIWVLSEVEALRSPDLDAIVEHVLPDLHYGAHRDVAERQPVEIDGRAGMRVETWDKLSHDHQKSYLFVLNADNLLVARMELGEFAVMQPAFDTLVETLEIHPSPNLQ